MYDDYSPTDLLHTVYVQQNKCNINTCL